MPRVIEFIIKTKQLFYYYLAEYPGMRCKGTGGEEQQLICI